MISTKGGIISGNSFSDNLTTEHSHFEIFEHRPYEFC